MRRAAICCFTSRRLSTEAVVAVVGVTSMRRAVICCFTSRRLSSEAVVAVVGVTSMRRAAICCFTSRRLCCSMCCTSLRDAIASICAARTCPTHTSATGELASALPTRTGPSQAGLSRPFRVFQ